MFVGALMSDGGSTSEKLSGRRGRILSRLRTELNNHPAMSYVAYKPTRDGREKEVVAHFDTNILANGVVDAEEAKLVVNWWTQPPDYDDQFTFHYTESTGYDCGWHRQPHENEDEIPFDHFQQRASPDDEYQYQGVDFKEDTPPGLVWEITANRLPRILRSRWDPDFEV
jgi:hypothetical protein